MKMLSKNIFPLLLAVLLINLVPRPCSAQYSKNFTLKDKNNFFADTANKKIRLSYKSPAAAGCLSFFLPGLAMGQLYNKDYTKFGVHLGISAGVFIFTMIAGQNKLYELSTFNVGGGPGKEGKREWILALCVVTYIGNWLWSTIDAVHSAAINNREIERQRKTGYNHIWLNILPGIGRDNKPNLNILVYF